MKIHLCKICGETNVDNFYVSSNTKCKSCKNTESKNRYHHPNNNRNKRNKNTEDFINTVKANHGDIYAFDNTIYYGSLKDVKVICKKHNHEFKVMAGTLLRRTVRNGGKKKNPLVGSCPFCRIEYLDSVKVPKQKRTKRVRQYKVKVPKEATLKYYNCDKHGNVLLSKNRNFKQGCPECNIEKNNNINHESFKKRIINKFGSQYHIEFNSDAVTFYCNKHNKYFTLANTELIKNRDKKYLCIDCYNELFNYNFISYAEAKKRVNSLGISSHAEYSKWHKRTCQTDIPSNLQKTYKKDWINFYEFFGTDKKSRMSAGEKRIYNYLTKKNIEFVWQKKFNDCRNINLLIFDFYLPKYNLIIEFDGEQHFKIGKFSKSVEVNQRKFNQVIINDRIKNKYCCDKNINLLRLDYKDLSNNVIEWSLDIEISKIAYEIAVFNS